MCVKTPLKEDDLDGFDPVDKKLMLIHSMNRPKTEAQSRKDKNNASALNADTKLGSKGAGKSIPKKLPWAHQNILGEVKIVELNKGKRPVTVKGTWFAGQMVPFKLGKSQPKYLREAHSAGSPLHQSNGNSRWAPTPIKGRTKSPDSKYLFEAT